MWGPAVLVVGLGLHTAKTGCLLLPSLVTQKSLFVWEEDFLYVLIRSQTWVFLQ
jgi:hypothetical protein